MIERRRALDCRHDVVHEPGCPLLNQAILDAKENIST